MAAVKEVFKAIGICVLALCIPCLLFVNALQAKRYESLMGEVKALEMKQEKLVQENKELITEISVLASSDRIETIAQEELGMRKAESDEIVRIGVGNND